MQQASVSTAVKQPEHHVFDASSNTREYHKARQEWLNSLRAPENSTKADFGPGIVDMDTGVVGKQGLYFNQGTVFYQFWRSNDERYKVSGYGELLLNHPGALFALLDDAELISYGEPMLTKYLRIVFEVPFGPEYAETFNVQVSSDVKHVSDDRSEIRTQAVVIDSTGRQLATSDGEFIQNATMKALSAAIKVNDEKEKYRAQVRWDALTPMRLAGEHVNDDKMSFALKLDANAIPALPLPTAWVKDAGDLTATQSSVLKGRIAMDHISFNDKRCRAVVQPLLTAEGPPGFLHGGGAATTWLDVLSFSVDLSQLQSFILRYKKPIFLGTQVTIEWILTDQGWKGEVKDFSGNVLQEMAAELREPSSSAFQSKL